MKTLKLLALAAVALAAIYLLCYKPVGDTRDSYCETKAYFAKVDWNDVCIDVPRSLPKYSVGEDITAECFVKVRDFYGFGADCVYQPEAEYEKNGVSLSVDDSGTVRLELCDCNSEENILPDDELIALARTYLESLGLWESSFKDSGLWTCFADVAYTEGVVFSHYTDEGYSLEDRAVTVHFSGDEVSSVEFRIKEMSEADFEDCISWERVKNKLKTVALYTWDKPGIVRLVRVHSADLVYSEGADTLYPVIYVEGELYDSKEGYSFFTAIPLY